MSFTPMVMYLDGSSSKFNDSPNPQTSILSPAWQFSNSEKVFNFVVFFDRQVKQESCLFDPADRPDDSDCNAADEYAGKAK